MAWPDLPAVREHLEIAEAVEARDPDAAELASRGQLRKMHSELVLPGGGVPMFLVKLRGVVASGWGPGRARGF